MTFRPMLKIAQKLEALRRNQSGVAAIEFAMLAPLLMLMTWGTLEIARGVMTHKRFQRVVAMVGDLVAREKQLGTTSTEAKAELAGIMESAKNVMLPFSTTPLKVAILSVRSSPNPPNSPRNSCVDYGGMNCTGGCPPP